VAQPHPSVHRRHRAAGEVGGERDGEALPLGVAACRPHRAFVTAMAAVAGAVADEILLAMTEAAPSATSSPSTVRKRPAAAA
jgi:hypothetical protein